MNIDAQQLVRNQQKLSRLFSDYRWKNGINIFQKEKIITELFHIKNWEQIDPTNRIILLQEIENIQARKQKRSPCQLVLLNPNYNFDTEFFDMMSDYNTKKIYMRRNFIEEGLKQNITDTGVEKVDINDRLNVELLDGVIHEGHHIWTKEKIIRIKTIENLTLEDKELILWIQITDIERNPKLDNNFQTMKNERYLYRLTPDEYYTFKYAKDYIDMVFGMLEGKFGRDKGFQAYLKAYNKEVSDIEQLYNQNNGIYLSYEDIYKRNFLDHIEKFINEDRKKAEEILSILRINKSSYQIDSSKEYR